MVAAQFLFIHSSASLHDSWGGAITASLTDLGGTHCVSCARGGPAVRQSVKQNLRLDLVGDPRPAIIPRGNIRMGRSDGGRSWYRGADAGAEARLASRFSASLVAGYDHVVNDQQWVANAGALRSDTTHYWQQGRSQSGLNPGTFDAPRDVSDLFAARPLNTLLVKMSYWFNP